MPPAPLPDSLLPVPVERRPKAPPVRDTAHGLVNVAELLGLLVSVPVLSSVLSGWTFISGALPAVAVALCVWGWRLPDFRRPRRARRLLRWLAEQGAVTAPAPDTVVLPGPRPLWIQVDMNPDHHSEYALHLWAGVPLGWRRVPVNASRTQVATEAVGNPAFDASVGVAPITPEVRAVLDRRTRRLLRRVVLQHGGWVKGGRLAVPLVHLRRLRRRDLPRLIGAWQALVEAFLLEDGALQRRLDAIVSATDEAPAVRVAAFAAGDRRPERWAALRAEGDAALTAALEAQLGPSPTGDPP